MKKILCFCLVLLICSLTAFAAQTHIVQKGDSLWKIAVRYEVGLSELITANPQFRDPNLIYPGDTVVIPVKDAQIDAMEKRVFELVNQERSAHGLKALAYDWQVARVAGYKACDMRDTGYFNHTSPVYGSPFDMLRNFGISFTAAGENIAKGQRTAEAVMQGWMNSQGHRANILNANYTKIGVGYCAGRGGPYWVQMFVRDMQ